MIASQHPLGGIARAKTLNVDQVNLLKYDVESLSLAHSRPAIGRAAINGVFGPVVEGGDYTIALVFCGAAFLLALKIAFGFSSAMLLLLRSRHGFAQVISRRILVFISTRTKKFAGHAARRDRSGFLIHHLLRRLHVGRRRLLPLHVLLEPVHVLQLTLVLARTSAHVHRMGRRRSGLVLLIGFWLRKIRRRQLAEKHHRQSYWRLRLSDCAVSHHSAFRIFGLRHGL